MTIHDMCSLRGGPIRSNSGHVLMFEPNLYLEHLIESYKSINYNLKMASPPCSTSTRFFSMGDAIWHLKMQVRPDRS